MLASKLALVLLVSLSSALANPEKSAAAERDRDEGDYKIKLVIFNAVKTEEWPEFAVYGVLKNSYDVVKLLSAEPGKEAQRYVYLKKYILLILVVKNTIVEAGFPEAFFEESLLDERQGELRVFAVGYGKLGAAFRSQLIYYKKRYAREEGRCDEALD